MSAQPDIRIFPDAPSLFRGGLQEVASQAASAVSARGRFTIALSGGSTPKGLYTLMAGEQDLPWEKMYFFFGDERHVPPDDPESNYRMVREALLSKVPIPGENIFRVHAENPSATQAADDYERTLRDFFQTAPGDFPRFDLILLGMGPDGHTASLFPGTSVLHEKTRLVASNFVEKFKTDRITLTIPVLNNAAEVMFLVSGAEKAQTLKEVLESSRPAELFPSKLIQPTSGKLIWMVDEEAAAALDSRP
jgi:6-phosphogluconolactonase